MTKGIVAHGLVALLALSGLVAFILGARALKQARAGSQSLYRVDTAGSQIEGDLEYETQESRRASLDALLSHDLNERLRYIDQARAAGNRVLDGVARMRALGAPDIAEGIDGFSLSWDGYRAARDQAIALVLEGESTAALEVEEQRGQAAFRMALRNLHHLKALFSNQARVESAELDRTLRRSAAALTGFGISILLIFALLGRVNLDRRVALESLRTSNAALAAEREMEQQRAAVLELVSSHAPLALSLDQIVKLAPRSAGGAGAAVWSAVGPHLKFQVAANVPCGLVDDLACMQLTRNPEISITLTEIDTKRADWAARFGVIASESRVLHDASGRVIGLLQVFVPAENTVLRTQVVDHMAQLSAVAIENTLLYERLAFQAQNDTLTELPNRMLFQDRVQQALRLARRNRKSAALLCIDLDRYKHINDTLGRRVADEVLCEIARRIKGCLRESDTVARVGGDEFAVLAYDIGSAADAERVCRKIITALARPMLLGEYEIAITASAGISMFPDHGDDPIVLVSHADLAMNSAKRAGGNCFQTFCPALGDTVLRHQQMEQELRTALARDEFSIAYQPLVNSHGGLEGVEALLRWTNPVLGRVSPGDFIPVAEEMGAILAIGEWAARTACSMGASWIRAGLETPRIAVNISAVQFVGMDFGSVIEQILKETGFPASKLVLEITETILMNNLEQALRQIWHLRGLGVRFAIDDFGTGYSSLSQLRTLPVDCVKIDRSFVKDLEVEGNGSSTLVRGIIALAHSLDLEVVAEGVETHGQLVMLRAMGCDIGQGFFLHRPMPAAQLEKLLRTVAATSTEGENPEARIQNSEGGERCALSSAF